MECGKIQNYYNMFWLTCRHFQEVHTEVIFSKIYITLSEIKVWCAFTLILYVVYDINCITVEKILSVHYSLHRICTILNQYLHVTHLTWYQCQNDPWLTVPPPQWPLKYGPEIFPTLNRTLCKLVPLQSMKDCRGVGVQLCLFLTSALSGGE